MFPSASGGSIVLLLAAPLLLPASGVGEGEPTSLHQSTGATQEAATTPQIPPPFRFEPGAATPAILVPRSEKLVYRAYLDVAVVSTNVGTVTQVCTVAEQRPSIVVATPVASLGEAASIKLSAEGSYLGYELESTLETRVLPQEWPRLTYLSVSTGKETRRRELQLGTKDGKPTGLFRADTKKGVPEGRPRIWREPVYRPVPEGTVDMLTAVLMARTLIVEKKPSITLPLLDKDRVWQLTLKRGEERKIKTGAGTFDALEVVLDPKPYPGESFAKDKLKKFEGVFGIHGSIHLWVDKKTGVAVRIQGDLPVGVFTLGIDVVLDSYSGTPPAFAPVKK